MVKTLRIDNIWNFATLNMYTAPKKILYLERYWYDFRNLCLSSKMFMVGIWVESFRCACVLLLQWQGENFSNRQHLKFCHVQPVNCASKNPMCPKVFTGFSKSLPQLEDVEGGHLGGKFQVRRYFTFAIARWKLFASTTFEILPRSTCSGTSKNPISPNAFHRFSKSLPQLEDVQCAHLSGKFQVHRYFSFSMARWKLCASKTFEILPRSTCSPYQQKSYVSKCIEQIFEIFASARRCWGWAFGWKVSGALVFYFCNGKVKTFRIDNIWNFATLHLFPVPAKIPCLQRYSINFRNLWLSSKMLRVGIWMESFRCAGILLLQWQRVNFSHRQHLKFCHFQHVQCASKNPISPKVFTRFSKSLHRLEDVQVGHLGGKFQARRYFTFAMARWKLCAWTTFEILPRSTCTLCQQKSYISKGIQPIFEIFASPRRCWGWAFGGNVSGAQLVYFCNGKVKTLRMENIWNFATFNM